MRNLSNPKIYLVWVEIFDMVNCVPSVPILWVFLCLTNLVSRCVEVKPTIIVELKFHPQSDTMEPGVRCDIKSRQPVIV